jgi:hypothetical protein
MKIYIDLVGEAGTEQLPIAQVHAGAAAHAVADWRTIGSAEGGIVHYGTPPERYIDSGGVVSKAALAKRWSAGAVGITATNHCSTSSSPQLARVTGAEARCAKCDTAKTLRRRNVGFEKNELKLADRCGFCHWRHPIRSRRTS